jgi:hypothetical protein
MQTANGLLIAIVNNRDNIQLKTFKIISIGKLARL